MKKVSNRQLLELLLHRQTLMFKHLLVTQYDYTQAKKIEKEWNNLWYKIIEGKEENEDN